MYSVLNDALKQWNKGSDRHTKLQHIYIVLAVAVLILAGLTSLINYSLGQDLLRVSGVLVGIFVINAVAWALADSFIVSNLSRRSNKR